MSEQDFNLDMNLENVNMELSFVANEYKPKSILAIEIENATDLVSLLLNADQNALITAMDCNAQTYEDARELFSQYDVLPRLNFYTGEPEEILPWLEGKFDLIVTNVPVEEEMLEALLNDGGHVAINKAIIDECDTCCFSQQSIANVKNYFLFA